jgi:hypothetical protein
MRTLESGYNLTLSDNYGDEVVLQTTSDVLTDVIELFVRACCAMSFTEEQVIYAMQVYEKE